MDFVVGDMAITTVGTDGDDRAIEFSVTRRGGDAQEAHFVIHRDHDQGWETARLTVDPRVSGIGVPVAAVEWAVEFAREYL
ncbi:hypothetical protein OG429_24220 [Streptomyces sp. NBC_00190]|uniref:hypothetical protein n=1 Tax=unclassified Streptomyces TaxID=2593676 RepID=UPI002E2D9B9F|nr:hypothetical protein [Streptomyces sp. NBC_00190]WSZ42124.1 hypothetical protein OG239_26995 [Streptomyces sp. NBC_00868]